MLYWFLIHSFYNFFDFKKVNICVYLNSIWPKFILSSTSTSWVLETERRRSENISVPKQGMNKK